MPLKVVPIDETRKGKRVCFSGKKYEGKFGWLDAMKGDTAKMRYVIVDYGIDETEGQMGIYTRLNKTSVTVLGSIASCDTFAQAVFVQRPKVNESIRKAVAECVLMMQCEGDATEFSDLFNELLQESYLAMLLKKNAEGPDTIIFDRKKKMEE